jgi:hypothetical protein
MMMIPRDPIKPNRRAEPSAASRHELVLGVISMKSRKFSSVVFSIVVACVVLLPAARASEGDQQTKVIFDQAVEIPGRVLPAGSYWLVRDQSQTDVIRIFSLDWKTLYTIELTIPAERTEPTDETTLTFAERESKPKALLTWFYPGELTGHQFLYRKQEQRELARDRQRTVVVASETAKQRSSGL